MEVGNVRGFGIVLARGCGHPVIELMLAGAEQMLDTPIPTVVEDCTCRSRRSGHCSSRSPCWEPRTRRGDPIGERDGVVPSTSWSPGTSGSPPVQARQHAVRSTPWLPAAWRWL
jgi:hypothetical protein